MMLGLQDRGCHNINFVTPEHVVPQILEAPPLAIDGGLRLPIVYNTSSYDSLDSLRLIDGIVDIYLPDLKIFTPGRARRYLRMPGYPQAARQAVTEMPHSGSLRSVQARARRVGCSRTGCARRAPEAELFGSSVRPVSAASVKYRRRAGMSRQPMSGRAELEEG